MKIPAAYGRLHAALNPGRMKERNQLNARYMLSMKPDRLMYNYYIEAGLNTNRDTLPERYGGWEDPSFQTRGSFTGHYLSACAMQYQNEGDERFLKVCEFLVSELARCQNESEIGWCCAIPPRYVEGIVKGKYAWAPQYMVHKTMMGLVDAYKYTGNKQALEVVSKWAPWFLKWTDGMTEEQLNVMVNYESGGLMETWAELYEITGDVMYRTLAERYLRKNIFMPLLEGKDTLTMIHANTSIPEAHGPAMLYEATGEELYRRLAEGFYRCGAEERPSYCTGGQSSAEIWMGQDLSRVLGERNEEHCTVYNMIRLADYLLRWSGDIKYAEYIEKNILNAIPAHQNKNTNAITYFLPLGYGVKKKWELPEEGMVCCAGSLVQAQASYGEYIFYSFEGGVAVSQFIGGHTAFEVDGTGCHISQHANNWFLDDYGCYVTNVHIDVDGHGKSFTVRLRVPSWCKEMDVSVKGVKTTYTQSGEWLDITGTWGAEGIDIVIPLRLRTEPLAGSDSRYALMCGPYALAALGEGDASIKADPAAPEKNFSPYNSLAWGYFSLEFVSNGADRNFRLMPLFEITDETYSVYVDFLK